MHVVIHRKPGGMPLSARSFPGERSPAVPPHVDHPLSVLQAKGVGTMGYCAARHLISWMSY